MTTIPDWSIRSPADRAGIDASMRGQGLFPASGGVDFNSSVSPDYVAPIRIGTVLPDGTTLVSGNSGIMGSISPDGLSFTPGGPLLSLPDPTLTQSPLPGLGGLDPAFATFFPNTAADVAAWAATSPGAILGANGARSAGATTFLGLNLWIWLAIAAGALLIARR